LFLRDRVSSRACDYHTGEAVTVSGRIRSVEFGLESDAITLKAELFDGTDEVTLVRLGRRRIPGIEPGRTLNVSGRIGDRDGHKVLYNPYYELQTIRSEEHTSELQSRFD